MESQIKANSLPFCIPYDLLCPDIVERVATITESEPEAVGETSYTAALVDRDSATRWARRLVVQFDVGELCFNCEAFIAEKLFRCFIFFGTKGAMVGVSRCDRK